MSRHNFINLIFLILFLSVIIGCFTNYITWWYIIILGLIYVAIIAWSSFDLRLQVFTRVIFKGKLPGKNISLTFDDGPTEFTPQILDLLEKHNAKATFFLIGKQVEKYPEIAKNIVLKGHIVGNHTYSHTNKMGFLNKESVLREIKKNQEVIYQILHVIPNWFRPPFGVTNPSISKAIQSSNLICIGWNIRSLDTISKSSAEIFNRVKRKLKPNGIILLHDTSENTVIALEQLLLEIKKQQFSIVPLQELIDESAYKNEKNTYNS